MVEVVWTITLVLAVIAALDRRAWPSLALLVLVIVQTTISEAMLQDRLSELAMLMPIDLVAGLMSLALVDRNRWTKIMPATFALMMLCHAAFWLARFNGIDLWLPYVHAQNAILVAQLMGLAYPGGGRLVGHVRSWLGGIRVGGSGRSFQPSPSKREAKADTKADRPADVGSGPDLFVSPEARA